VRHTLRGSCHCGNLELRFETDLDPWALPLRACGCSFCRRHGARATSDPAGRVEIRVHDPAHLIRHRFAQRTADFLVCGRCGVYVAALMPLPEGGFATLNANTFEAPEPFARAAEPVCYEGESADARRARRRARWTPVVAVREGGS
jgi:hypothetical protein